MILTVLFFDCNMLMYVLVGSFGDREDERALHSFQELFPGGRAATLFVAGGGALLFTLGLLGDAHNSRIGDILQEGRVFDFLKDCGYCCGATAFSVLGDGSFFLSSAAEVRGAS